MVQRACLAFRKGLCGIWVSRPCLCNTMYQGKRNKSWCLQTYHIVSKFLKKDQKQIEYSPKEILLRAAGRIQEQELAENLPKMLMAAEIISSHFMSKRQILREIQIQFLVIWSQDKLPLPNFIYEHSMTSSLARAESQRSSTSTTSISLMILITSQEKRDSLKPAVRFRRCQGLLCLFSNPVVPWIRSARMLPRIFSMQQ